MNPQEQHEYDVAVQNGHQHFYESIPVYKPEVVELLNAIKKKRPELVVVEGFLGFNKHGSNGIYRMYYGLSLAFANVPTQIVGGIGYDGDVYYVTSRLIENARFSPWNSHEHHSKKSKHMNNVVKEAIKALLPTQFREVIGESLNTYNSRIHDIRSMAIYRMREKLNNTNHVLRDELFHMVEQGYTPKNKEFAEAMKYVVESKDEYDRNQNYDPDRVFVWIKPDCVVYGECEEKAQQVASTDELPEEIRGKLFVLMVSDKDTFIDEVGMKAGDNKFWVIL